MPHSSAARLDQTPANTVSVGLGAELLSLCREAFTLHQAGRFVEAVLLYERILRLNFALPEIHNNFGNALGALGKHALAVKAYQHAIDLKADYPEAFCNWGLALQELERPDEAEAKYRQAIKVRPRFSGAYNNLGLLLKQTGRLAEAQEAFEKAIELEPTSFSFYDNLAAVRPFTADDAHLAALEAAAEAPFVFSDANQIHLHFALAKAYDGLDRSEQASRHLLDANRLKRRQITYNEADMLRLMDQSRTLVGREFIQGHEGCGAMSAAPVFIVGMTRSGSTLIEQILSSHPQVRAAGELPILDQVAGSIRNELPGVPRFPDMILEMSPSDFRTLGELYVARIAQRAPSATRITDKMTVNFLFVGLIHLALPNATIIHALRDPLDTCLSCFATHFTRGHEHTYDLAELGRYYRHYRDLMAHWHDVLPAGRIMDVRYEDLVGDLEGVARRVVSHCGLAWDARCLDFHRNERPVRTASSVQVRKPIYRDSIGRSHKYEAMLRPLVAELGPYAAESAQTAPA